MNDLVSQNSEGAYRDGLGYALWCLAFVGLAGIHRIYLGKYGTGSLWLRTFGLFGVGQFIDLFRMKSLGRAASIREGYLPHPRVVGQLMNSLPLAQSIQAGRMIINENLNSTILIVVMYLFLATVFLKPS